MVAGYDPNENVSILKLKIFKMSDYFKADILKKEFQDFIENVLPKVLECGLCKKYLCKWHKQFLVSCNQCRQARCLSCITFKSSVEILIKTLDSDGKNYVQNFITDFLKISNETLQHLFKVETNVIEGRSKLKTFDLRIYHKSEENRSEAVMKTLDDCNKIQYVSKRRKRTFYKII